MEEIRKFFKIIYVGCKLSKGWAKIHKSEARINRLEKDCHNEKAKLTNTIVATQGMLDEYMKNNK